MNIHGQIEAKRAAAQRARRLAPQIGAEKDQAIIRAFADELDAEADALVALLDSQEPPVPPRTEMQMQQQAQAESKDEDDE